MRATVLPKKQLRYILAKQDFVEIKNGDFEHRLYIFPVDIFDLCLKTIEVSTVKHPFFHYRYEVGRYLCNKNWFIPNSFTEN